MNNFNLNSQNTKKARTETTRRILKIFNNPQKNFDGFKVQTIVKTRHLIEVVVIAEDLKVVMLAVITVLT